MLMLTIFLTIFACEEKNDEFSILTGASNEPSSDLDSNDTNEDTDLDTGVVEPSSEDTQDTDGEGVMSEQECMPSDSTVNEDPNNLVGRPDCGYYTYSQSCTDCHGANGEGTPSGQQLVGHIDGHPDSDLIRSIVEGEGSMPAYDNMHPQNVADVVAYMRREFQQ